MDRDDGRPTGERDGTPEDIGPFTGLVGHFYRAEMDRVTAWRGRLDRTTNWAVVVMATVLTWAFTGTDGPHLAILVGMLAATAFLLVEAHRYREYDIWRRRVRTMQGRLFADLFESGRVPAPSDDAAWRRDLSADLRSPTIRLAYLDALSHRLRRVYFPLLLVAFVAWVARITVFDADPWRRAAALPGLSGETVVTGVCLFYLLLAGVTLWHRAAGTLREATE